MNLLNSKRSIAGIIFFLLGLFISEKLNAAVYYTKAAGNWNDPAVWSTVACGDATNTGTYPQISTDDVIICHNLIINVGISVGNVTIESGIVVDFDPLIARNVTINGNLTLNTGYLRHNGNLGLLHTLNIGGNITNNNGWLLLDQDANDYVDVTFLGSGNSVITGSGGRQYSFHNIILHKSTNSAVLEIQDPSMYTTITGFWTLTQGIFHHNNTATFSMASIGADLTIGSNATVRCSQGTLNLSPSGNVLWLEGKLRVTGGTVNIGRSAAGLPAGIRYRSLLSVIPELEISSGTLNVYQGIMYGSSGADPFKVTISGGVMNLNTGTNATDAGVFFINDVAGSNFTMSGGRIVIQKKGTGGFSDFYVCGNNGTVISTGGTVEFGNASSLAQDFTFTPYANATLPNFKVTGPAATAITLKPFSTGNVRLLSLYIDQGKFFDPSHNNTGDSRTITLTSTYDGNHSFYDNNNSIADHFIRRNTTVHFTGTSSVKPNSYDQYTMRFFRVTCAEPGQITTFTQGCGIADILTINGGRLTSSNFVALSLYAITPLTITNGSIVAPHFFNFMGGGGQNLTAYNYNTTIVCAAGGNTLYQLGNVTCDNLYVNGDWVPGRTVTYITNNHNLTINNTLLVGNTGGVRIMNIGSSNVIVDTVVLEQDAVVNASTSTITVNKLWDNNSTNLNAFDEGTGRVIFGGDAAISVEKALPAERFYNVTINKSAGDVTLYVPIEITNNFTFTSGKIISTTTNKVIFLGSANATGASSSSFVSGPVQRYGTGSFTFPIGKGTVYGPLSIAPGGPATDAFTAEYFNADPDPLYSTASKDSWISSISRCEYWSLARDVGTTNTKVTLGYNSSSCQIASYASFSVASWNGTTWKDYGRGASSSGNATSGSIQSCTVVNHSYNIYTLGVSNVPVPGITADGPTTFCAGQSVTLTANAASSYLWSTGATTQSIVVTTTGNYSVTLTDAGGCSGSASSSQSVTVNALPSAPAANPGYICAASGTTTLYATGSTGTYNWYDASTNGTLLGAATSYTTPTISANTTYYLVAVSASGCESSPRTAVNVTVNTTAPGNPADPGNGTWNAYVYSDAFFTQYAGYYVHNTLSFDSKNMWDHVETPSNAATYQGCQVGNDNFSVSYYRKSFTPGIYTIEVEGIDDNAYLYVNGQLKATISWPNNSPNAWTGYLDNNSTVEFKWSEFTGFSHADIAINSISDPNDLQSGTIAENQTICEGAGVAPDRITARKFKAIEDTYVENSPSPDSNFGSNSTLQIKNNVGTPHRITYLKFDLTNLTLPIDNAYLAVQAGHTSGILETFEVNVHAISDPWNESTVTYTTRPTLGAELSSFNVSSNTYNYYYIDLTSHIIAEKTAGRNTLSLALKSYMNHDPSILVQPRESVNAAYIYVNKPTSTCELSYQWQQSSGCTGTWSDIVGETLPHYDPPASLTQNTCYRLVTSDACGNSAITNEITITVNDPSVAGTLDETDVLCAGTNSKTLRLNGYTGDSILWQLDANGFSSTSTNLTNAADTLAINNLASSTYYRTIVRSGICAPDTSNAVAITISPLPLAPSASDNGRCGNGTVLLTATGSSDTYQWYNAASGGSLLHTGASYTTPVINDTTVYYVGTLNTDGCQSASRTPATAIIKPIPPVPSVNNTTVCENTTASLAATGSPDTYKWYDASSGGTLLHIGTPYTPTVASATTFYVSSIDTTGCESSRQSLNVTTDVVSNAGVLNSTDTLCGPINSKIIHTTGYTGNSIIWEESSNNFSTVISSLMNFNDSLTLTNIAATRFYRVIVKSGVCPADTSNIIKITVGAIPSTPLTTGKDTCGNGSVLLTASGSSETYQWFDAASGGSHLHTGANYQTPILNDTTVFYVETITSEGCTSASRATAQVNIKSIPSIPSASDNGRCGNGTIVLTATGSTDTYQWYDQSSAGALLHTGSSYTTPSLTDTTVYYVGTVNIGGCYSASRTMVRALIKPIPSLPVVSDQSGCTNSTVALTASGSPDTYHWYKNASGGAPLQTGIPYNVVITKDTLYYVSSVDTTGCESDREVINISIITLSNAGTLNAADTLCAGTNAKTLRLAGYFGDTFNWEWSTDNFATAPTPIVNNRDSLIVSNVAVTTYYRAIVASGTCTSDTTNSIKITISPLPSSPSASDKGRCGDGTLTLNATSSFASDILKWFDAPVAGTEVHTGLSYTTSVLTDTTLYYVETIDSLGCISSTRTMVRAIIKPIPAAPICSDTTICETGSATLVATGSPSNYRWYDASTGGSLLTTGSSYSPPVAENKTYYVSAVDTTACEGDRTAVTVSLDVVSLPGTMTSDETLCEGSDATISITGHRGNILRWEYSDDNFSTAPTSMVVTLPDLDLTNITQTRAYRSVIQNGVCPAINSSIVTLTVDVLSDAGTLGSSDVVCLYGNSGTLTLTGNNGSIVGWESSTDNFASAGIPIVSTAATYNYTNLPITTFYRAVVKNGNCPIAYSNTTVISVSDDPTINPGQLGNDTLVIGGSNSGVITLTGHNSTIDHWEISTNNGISFSSVANNTNTYTFNNITTDIALRVISQGIECPGKSSDTIRIRVNYRSQINVDTFYTSKNTVLNSESSILDNDADPENDALQVNALNAHTTPQAGIIDLNGDGHFTYTPLADFVGLDTITYTVCSPTLPGDFCVTGKLYIRVREIYEIQIYPAVSPNNDGKNDSWVIDNIDKFPDNKVTIFDRWGNIVFTEEGYDNFNKVWKGNSNRGITLGNDLPDDTYFYHVTIGGSKEFKGYVVLRK